MTGVRLTHIGGPTLLIEAGGWRLLTDPAFDPPGRRYAFGWGTSSVKTTGPAVRVEELGRVDAVLLTHGPPLSRPVVGDVIGFALDGLADGTVWISGDTVVHRDLLDVAGRLDVEVAVLHLGAVRFPLTGPLRYTMTAWDAVRLCRVLRPRAVVPVHHEGWSHFGQGHRAAQEQFDRAPQDPRDALRWLDPGRATEVLAAGR